MEGSVYTDTLTAWSASSSFLWRFSGFCLIYGIYQNMEKPLKHQRRFGLMISQPWNMEDSVYTDTLTAWSASPSFLWRFSGFCLFWYLPHSGKYQNMEKPVKHQRRLGLMISQPWKHGGLCLHRHIYLWTRNFFMVFCHVQNFFQNQHFPKKSFINIIWLSNFWILIRPNILLGQNICKGCIMLWNSEIEYCLN